ncbi:hypothetical protein I4U23_021591 [Adineta vaga]|nr:hypothetical protein I4U23_021591 [Adineta vaga]
MGSTVESLYFQKPLLCLPSCMDQYLNSIANEHSGVGESLFQPPSIIESFQKPFAYHKYTFTTNDVTSKMMMMWRNEIYSNNVT